MVKERTINPSSNQPNDVESLKNFADKAKEVSEHFGRDFPHGMEPIGNGLYKTPDVIDPRDCDNYPESIYCGGKAGYSWPPKFDTGIDFDYGINDCGGYVSAKGSIAGFSLPTHSLAYVRDKCRQDYEKEERDRADPPPKPPPDWSKGRPPNSPQYRPSGFGLNDEVIVVTSDTYYIEEQQWCGDAIGWAVSYFGTATSFNRLKWPSDLQVPSYRFPSAMVTATASVTGEQHYFDFRNSQWMWKFSGIGSYDPSNPPEPSIQTGTVPIEFGMPPDQPFDDNYGEGRQLRRYFTPGEPSVFHLAIWIGKLGSIFPNYQISPLVYQEGESKDGSGRTVARFFQSHTRNILYIRKTDGSGEGNRPHYDSPPPPPKDCCMQCCGSKSPIDQALLGLILKEVRNVKKVVGYDEFPVRMPESLIDKDEGFIGNLIPNAPVEEPNLAKLLARFIRYFDEIMGQWEIPIEIKDTDPNEPGDQPKGVRLKNVAEALADLYAVMIDSYVINQQLLQVGSKNLIETGLTKQNVVQNYYALLCLIDFFGFKYKEIDAKVPLSFKVGEEKYEDFIKESEQTIKVFDVDVNDKNVVTYKDDMAVLKHAASIIKAVYFRKLDHKGDMKQQLIDLVKQAAQYSGKVTSGEIKPGGGKTDEFEKWCEDAETEFSRQTGINTQQPYGRPYDQRPRITILNPDGGTANPPSGGV